MLIPKKLKAGDKVATVSSSWGGAAIFPHRYEAGKKQLVETFDLQVVEAPNCLKPADFIARNPKARADDLMWAFANPEINAIISVIGGDDSIRMLPYLDLNVIRNNPKIFMGYSDTTVTHFACFKAGLCSYYGPSIMAGFAENQGMFDYTVRSIRSVLFDGKAPILISESDVWTNEMLDWANPELQYRKRKTEKPIGRKVLQGKGVHKGRLLGGCSEVLEVLKGTVLWPEKSEWAGSILFLETSEEMPPIHYFKRWIRALGAQDILQSLNGILLARPALINGAKDLEIYDRALLDVVAGEYGLTELPIISQMDFGHTDPMSVLPLGLRAEIDCDKGLVTITENTVED
jgi:muramoyltetrapeptide carboxypeptidase LdcA involved in peptidoglycan recycling